MRITFLFIIACLAGKAQAQQDPQFTLFQNTYSLVNPAASGLFYKHSAGAGFRDQWNGFPGHPITAYGFYDIKLNPIHGGLGVNYSFDKLGYQTNHAVNLNYAYLFDLKNNRTLSAGIAIGIYNSGIDGTHWVTSDGSPNGVNDPSVPQGKSSGTALNTNFGVFYKSNHLLLGLSSTHLNEGTIQYNNVSYNIVRHYYLAASYRFDIGESFDIKPGIFLKTEFASTQCDFNILYTYKKRYWAGISYRIDDAICFMAGVDIKGKFRVGYSYDVTTSSLQIRSSGSHEVILALMLD